MSDLGPGERIVDGQVVYSSRFLNDETRAERRLRLLTPRDEQPGPSARERRLISEAQDLLWKLDEARQELADACALEAVELTVRASLRLYSIGALLYINADKLRTGPKQL